MVAKKEGRKAKSKALSPEHEVRGLSPFDEFDRLMGAFMRNRWPRLLMRDWPSWPGFEFELEREMPRVDIVDQDDKIEVTAELPGIKKEDLDISVTDDRITIRGASSEKKEEEKGECHRREIRRGEFARTLTLPADVNGAEATAKFEDGMLRISLPKLAKTERKSIKVD